MTIAYPTTSGVTFKDIEGFPGYCVGDDGTVWSRRVGYGGCGPRLAEVWHKLKAVPNPYRSNYVSVNLMAPDGRSKLRLVHRLVLEAFVGLRPPGMDACHDPDHDPSNNRLDNLRWDTKKANMADMLRQGRRARGWNCTSSKLAEQQVAEVYLAAEAGETQKSIAARYSVTQMTISRVIRRKTYRCDVA